MALARRFTRRLIEPGQVPASSDAFEVVGTFNPGVARVGGEVLLLVRVAERPRAARSGWIGLPRWDPSEGQTVDWVRADEWEYVDARVVRDKREGIVRLTYTSHLRVANCGPDCGRLEGLSPELFLPDGELEEYGVEDPRVTRVGDRFYFTYVAVSRHGPATALASTTDFRAIERHGVIFCAENKDVVLFPERVGGAFVALHRPVCGSPFTRPEIWLAWSDDLVHWGRHAPLSLGGYAWSSGRTGAGAPPIRVGKDWLVIYHGNQRPTLPGQVGAYVAGAFLLDGDDPSRVLAASDAPFLVPEESFEREGFVPDVVFPTGVVEVGDELWIFYGAGDAVTAVVGISTAELLASLRPVV